MYAMQLNFRGRKYHEEVSVIAYFFRETWLQWQWNEVVLLLFNYKTWRIACYNLHTFISWRTPKQVDLLLLQSSNSMLSSTSVQNEGLKVKHCIYL